MTETARVAAIDIGTNTALMLIAERRHDGEVVACEDHATITRLGKGVDRTRRLDDDAVARTLEVLRGFALRAKALGVSATAAVATSATRDSANGEAFRAAASSILGGSVEVASGDREAMLTFAGALGGLELDDGARVAVVDVGGGSTEIVIGRTGTRAAQPSIEWAHSFDVGSVRMTERHVRNDPPIEPEIEAVAADLARAFADAAWPVEGVGPLAAVVAIAGTATTYAAIDLELADYASAPPHGHRLGLARLDAMIARLAALPLSARREVIGLEPARADVIVAGGLTLRAATERLRHAELVVSDRGVRWGLALELLEASAR